MTKRCTKCQVYKPLRAFFRRTDRPVGVMSHCRKCMAVDRQKWQRKHKAHVTTYAATYRRIKQVAVKTGMADYKKRCALRFEKSVRNSSYKRFGMKNSDGTWFTTHDYAALFSRQNGRCLICERHRNTFSKRFAVDHDHATGTVRGLLCNECNVLLAFAHDSELTLHRAINYLKGTLTC